MIVDLRKFVERERPYWDELEGQVRLLEGELDWRGDLAEAQRIHYLYERAAAALARVRTFSGDPELAAYLETLVGRAYSAIHSLRRSSGPGNPVRWFFGTLPRTFRAHAGAFALSLAATLAGGVFGAAALLIDYDQAKPVLMPFSHLQGSPSERVRQEERTPEQSEERHGGARGEPMHTGFAAMLMTHNIKVSFAVLALGLTFGLGSLTMLFYNGVILGAVCCDYVLSGESVFLAGWLLPHGSIEIPAILVAGQASFVLARALIGHGDRNPLKARMRQVMPDVVTLVGGMMIMLVWAGIIESFLSQYHKPVVPYWLKISFGCVELALLAAFFGLCGRVSGKASGFRHRASGAAGKKGSRLRASG